MTIHVLILYYTVSPPMQHNNTDPHYVHVYEKYRHRVISLLTVLSEKYTYVLFSILSDIKNFNIYMKLFYSLLFFK